MFFRNFVIKWAWGKHKLLVPHALYSLKCKIWSVTYTKYSVIFLKCSLEIVLSVFRLWHVVLISTKKNGSCSFFNFAMLYLIRQIKGGLLFLRQIVERMFSFRQVTWGSVFLSTNDWGYFFLSTNYLKVSFFFRVSFFMFFS